MSLKNTRRTAYWFSGEAIKKLTGESGELEIYFILTSRIEWICKLYTDLSSHFDGVEGIGTFSDIAEGCQGFIGPFPSAFLDKFLKNWPTVWQAGAKVRSTDMKPQKYFSNGGFELTTALVRIIQRL